MVFRVRMIAFLCCAVLCCFSGSQIRLLERLLRGEFFFSFFFYYNHLREIHVKNVNGYRVFGFSGHELGFLCSSIVLLDGLRGQ